MKAWITHPEAGIDRLTLSERPEPQLAPGEVLVRVRAVALNYRDILVVEGHRTWRPAVPRVPASDGAGEVIALGEGVTRFQIGDRVASVFYPEWIDGPLERSKMATPGMGGANTDGMLAEVRAIHERGLVAIPEHLTFEEGATLPVAGVTAWNSVIEQGNTQLGDAVLVQGSGGVALFALQFARLAGARVIALTSTPAKSDRLKQLGADTVINYRETPDWDRAVRESNGGGGVGLVVDILGGAMDRSLRSTKIGGLVSLVGNLGGFAITFDLASLSSQARIQDVAVGSRRMFEKMNNAITHHLLHPVVDRVFPFEEAPAALQYLKSGQHVGKVCISVGS